MKTGEFAELNQPRHDHLDVHVRRMVAQIDQAESLRAKFPSAVITRAPIVNDGGIERRLVELVFDEQSPVVRERGVDVPYAIEVAFEHPPKMLLAGKVSAVSNPHRVGFRTELLANLNALDVVCDCLFADCFLGMCQAAEFVGILLPGLILKRV